MTHEFRIRDISTNQGIPTQAKDLVLLLADEARQRMYGRILAQDGKSEKVVMVRDYLDALEQSKLWKFSAHILYAKPDDGALEFAKVVRDAKGPAHPIVFVASPDLRGIVEEMGYEYIDGSDEDHTNAVLDYIR